MTFDNSTKTVARTAAIFMAIAATAMMATVVAPVQAQDSDQDDTTGRLLACDAMSDPTAKLACFNAVVDGIKPGLETPAADSQSVSASVPDAAPAAAPPVAAAPPIEVAPEPAAPITVTATTPADIPSVPPDTASNGADDFGRDSMKSSAEQQEEKRAETINATIVRTWTHHDERFSVELDNGQIWRENSGSRIRRRIKVGSSVEITKRSLGSYRMNIEGIPMNASVRRTK